MQSFCLLFVFQQLKVYVETSSGQKITCHLPSDETTWDLRWEAYWNTSNRENFDQYDLDLVFDGKEMEEDEKLKVYGITNESTVQMVSDIIFLLEMFYGKGLS